MGHLEEVDATEHFDEADAVERPFLDAKSSSSTQCRFARGMANRSSDTRAEDQNLCQPVNGRLGTKSLLRDDRVMTSEPRAVHATLPWSTK